MKVIIYGSPDSGRDALAVKLAQDNPMLAHPVTVTNAKEMRAYLNTTDSRIGIVNAQSIAAILTRCPGQKFGTVLFIAAPGLFIAPPVLETSLIDDGLASSSTAFDPQTQETTS